MTQNTPLETDPFDDHFRDEAAATLAALARSARAPGALEQMFGYFDA